MHLILFKVAVTSVYYVTIMTTHMSLTSKWNECLSMYYIGLNTKQKFRVELRLDGSTNGGWSVSNAILLRC